MQLRHVATAAGAIWPGLLGGLAATGLALLLRTEAGIPLFAEIVLDAATHGLHPYLFETLLQVFGRWAKALLFLSVTMAEVGLYVACWVVAHRARTNGLRRAVLATVLPTAVLLVVTTILWLVTAADPPSSASVVWYSAGTLGTSMVFASVAYLASWESAELSAEGRRTRRQILGSGVAVAAGVLGFMSIGRMVRQSVEAGARRIAGRLTPEVTPNADFYVVSKNLIDPEVDVRGWRLRVGGSSRELLQLSYADVLSRPQIREYATMQCISNPVGGPLMSNALWTGVRLRDLLDEVGPSPAARHVLFRSADDYEETLPLEFAMGDGVLLAHAMNGEPLSNEHGFPLRLLAPGKYGIKHPKWITEILLIDDEQLGYWQRRYWTQEARMNTSSRIDVPADGARLTGGRLQVQGVAFAGDRGISRVEVSADGGRAWAEATLRPPLSPYTWVLWSFESPLPPNTTALHILARATDGTGEVQTSERAFPAPSGATGFPEVTVKSAPF